MSKTFKHEIKTDFLLDKGVELLWANGYNATSVNDIVKAADIPKGSFYFYFENKEDFAVKAIDRYFNQQFEPISRVLNDTTYTAKQRLLNFYEFRVTILNDHLKCKMGCLGSNISTEMSEHSEKIRLAVLQKGSYVKEEIIKVALEAQENGDIDATTNVRDLVEFVEDAGKGVMISMKEMKDPYPIDNFLRMVKKLI